MTVTVTQGNFTATNFGYAKYLDTALPYLAGGSISDSIVVGKYPYWTWQVTGTFGSGGSIQMEGSNDGGTTWAIIGSAVTSAGLTRGSTGLAELIRFNVTAGDGSTSLNVYLTLADARA